MLRQLYLYAAYVETQMGFPDLLSFNAFRDGEIITVPFEIGEYHETIDWAHRTVDTIRHASEWPHKEKPDYFCTFLCSVYASCPLMGY